MKHTNYGGSYKDNRYITNNDGSHADTRIYKFMFIIGVVGAMAFGITQCSNAVGQGIASATTSDNVWWLYFGGFFAITLLCLVVGLPLLSLSWALTQSFILPLQQKVEEYQFQRQLSKDRQVWELKQQRLQLEQEQINQAPIALLEERKALTAPVVEIQEPDELEWHTLPIYEEVS